MITVADSIYNCNTCNILLQQFLAAPAVGFGSGACGLSGGAMPVLGQFWQSCHVNGCSKTYCIIIRTQGKIIVEYIIYYLYKRVPSLTCYEMVLEIYSRGIYSYSKHFLPEKIKANHNTCRNPKEERKTSKTTHGKLNTYF